MKSRIIFFIALIVLSSIGSLLIHQLTEEEIIGYKGDTFWGGKKNAHLLLNRILANQNHIAWSTGNHTAALLPLGAVGPKKYTDQLKGIIDNTKIAEVMKEAVSEKLNVILIIGDGMGPNHMSMAVYKNIAEENGWKTFFEKVMNEGESAFIINNPYGEIVGSSATTATSIACGIKTRVNMIGVDHNGFPAENVLEVAEKQGLVTGIISDSKIIDATPAAFFGHSTDRYDLVNFTRQLVEHNIEVIFGGGGADFIPQGKRLSQIPGFEDIHPMLDNSSHRKDEINYLDKFSSQGYKIINNRKELNELDAASGKVVGFFSADAMNTALERKHKVTGEPSISELTQRAIEILHGTGKNFFLMVEAARIDFESHDNDPGAVLHTVLEMDEIVGAGYNFYKNNKENTLLIFTADHETGGLSFTYTGVPREKREAIQLENGETYYRTKYSITFNEYQKIMLQDKPIFRIFQEAKSEEDLSVMIKKHLPYEVSEDEIKMLFNLLSGYQKGK